MSKHYPLNILKERRRKRVNQVNKQIKTYIGDDTDVNMAEIYKVHRHTRGSFTNQESEAEGI